MFEKYKHIWQKHGFTILSVSCVVFILLYWFFVRRNKKGGTYNTEYEYSQRTANNPKDSKGETKCRQVLENMFNKPFPKVRPKFLFNTTTGRNLELDMFNSDLLIACEYNGQQHYNYTPFFHRSRQAFYDQQNRDNLKRRVCKKLGIKLIEVPYTIPNNQIENFIRKELNK